MKFKSWSEWRKGSEDLLPDVSDLEWVEVDPTLIKVNEATKEDLLEIKGIGPKTANKIIQQQPYQDLEELELAAAAKKRLIIWASS